MDPSTHNVFLAQVNEAQVWTGEYFVPDLNNDGKLVPVREGIQMTKTKDGIRRIMQVAGAGELTFHGKNSEKYVRLVCPFGRTARTKKKGGGTKEKGSGDRTNLSYSKRGTGCQVVINVKWNQKVVVFVWFGCL